MLWFVTRGRVLPPICRLVAYTGKMPYPGPPRIPVKDVRAAVSLPLVPGEGVFIFRDACGEYAGTGTKDR
jgi:hypothetical protein